MSLFVFELRKLLVNKKTVILLIVLFALYSVIGFSTSLFLIGSNILSLLLLFLVLIIFSFAVMNIFFK